MTKGNATRLAREYSWMYGKAWFVVQVAWGVFEPWDRRPHEDKRLVAVFDNGFQHEGNYHA